PGSSRTALARLSTSVAKAALEAFLPASEAPLDGAPLSGAGAPFDSAPCRAPVGSHPYRSTAASTICCGVRVTWACGTVFDGSQPVRATATSTTCCELDSACFSALGRRCSGTSVIRSEEGCCCTPREGPRTTGVKRAPGEPG